MNLELVVTTLICYLLQYTTKACTLVQKHEHHSVAAVKYNRCHQIPLTSYVSSKTVRTSSLSMYGPARPDLSASIPSFSRYSIPCASNIRHSNSDRI